MSETTKRPQYLWNHKSLTPSVNEYLGAYQGEFDTDGVVSRYPYKGPSSDAFQRVARVESPEESAIFKGMGGACWSPRRDKALNPLTADLLAAADKLGGKLASMSSSALPGGIGADSDDILVKLLDGGVSVEVVLWEHQYTNRIHARQHTTIRGPKAYRTLLELLSFNWIRRRLPGEISIPTHDDIKKLVNDLLARTREG